MTDPIGRPKRMPAVGPALSLVVIFVAVLSIPLDAASNIGLTPEETATWIFGIYGLAGALSIVLARRFRQPLLFTGNIFVLILISRLGSDFTWPQLIGATVGAGILVLIISRLGLTEWLTRWVPAPIVFGLLGGAVFPFVVDMFTLTRDEPWLVGVAVTVYVLARRWAEPTLPAILPALVAAVIITALSGDFGTIDLAYPAPTLTVPAVSLRAMLTVTPIMVVLITVQANIPSVVFLEEQTYRPGHRLVNTVSGVGTAAGSLLGPIGVSLSLPATALVAGPDAGDTGIRYWAVYLAGGASVIIALLAGPAVAVSSAIPASLLTTAVGLAVLGLLIAALPRITSGGLLWGPVFSFAIAASEARILGLSEFFWAIVGGIAVSLLLERDDWRAIHTAGVR